jgi:hypothetical protein
VGQGVPVSLLSAALLGGCRTKPLGGGTDARNPVVPEVDGRLRAEITPVDWRCPIADRCAIATARRSAFNRALEAPGTREDQRVSATC